MRRKIGLVLIVSMALFLTTIPEGKWTVAAAEDVLLTDQRDEIGETSIYGYIPVEKTILNEQDLESQRSAMSNDALSEIPSSYDAREEGLLTEIKSQGALGNCWAYAAMGVSESNILCKELESMPDLSEYHLSYSGYNKALDPLGLTEEDISHMQQMSNDIYSWGGNDYLAVSVLARWQGAVEEELAPVEDLKTAVAAGEIASLPEELMYDADCYHLQNAEFIYLSEENRDRIKQKLMEHGSATISFHAPENQSERQQYGNTGSNNFTAYYCDDTTVQVNHEVMVVGWDDDYAVSNFNPACQPANPGAWLIRNSWGDNNEQGGYFWLSYEDTMLQLAYNEDAEVVFYDVEPADNYDHNYQYDGGVAMNYVRGYSSIANVFTAQENEKLQAVSFYTQERKDRYSISVYRITDASEPATGIQLGETLTGTLEERGYHTIDFTDVGGQDIPLAEGDIFSVVLRLTDANGSNTYYTYESAIGISDLEESIAAGANESFALSGSSWADFAETTSSATGQKRSANFCLKAFTSAATEEEIAATPSPSATSAATPDATPVVTPDTTPAATPEGTATSAPTSTAESVTENIPDASGEPSAVPSNPVYTATVSPTPGQSVTPVPTSAPKTIVKKLKFRPAVKTVKTGKRLKVSKYLKITKNRSGTPKIAYEFTKRKYKKYASLSSKGVLKAKKAGKKKTIYVRARARDGSGKTAKIKIKIV